MRIDGGTIDTEIARYEGMLEAYESELEPNINEVVIVYVTGLFCLLTLLLAAIEMSVLGLWLAIIVLIVYGFDLYFRNSNMDHIQTKMVKIQRLLTILYKKRAEIKANRPSIPVTREELERHVNLNQW